MVSLGSLKISFFACRHGAILFHKPVSFPLRLKRVNRWERIASRWRPAFSSHLVSSNRTRPRGQHTRRRITKNLHPRSSEARQENCCPLDKDLLWKSDDRKIELLTRCPFSQRCKKAQTVHPVRGIFFIMGMKPMFVTEKLAQILWFRLCWKPTRQNERRASP